ncbi:lantibiotic dehydratase [Streptomyces chrestomyceticus]|uniref:lantibiotic dehydratase n=1 Tax=Streptomyces chrestomyceticus TaxID=68185 RepID=UPI0033D55499
MGSTPLRYQCEQSALVRSVHHPGITVPPWPDLADTSPAGIESWVGWMRQVWGTAVVADAVRHASPDLAHDLDTLVTGPAPRDAVGASKLMLALAGYLLRLGHRAAPFGLFAGVSEARVGPRTTVRWGTGHRAVARADGTWLAHVITGLESLPEVRALLTLVATDVAVVRGERLVVPWRPRRPGARTTAVREVSVRHTPVVRAVLEMARTPVPYREVARRLAEGSPDVKARTVCALLDELITHRVLISSLHPPATEPDALGYLLDQLESAGAHQVPTAAEPIAALRTVHGLMAEHNRRPAFAGRNHRRALVERMREHVDVPDPLAVDLHLDAEVQLPHAVAWEAEAAVAILARLTPYPYGAPAWHAYRHHFLERYGPHVLVPLLECTDPVTGIGLPDGFHGAAPAPQPPLSSRDRRLFALAQRAVLEGRDIELDEHLIEHLAVGDPALMQPPPHTELLAELHSHSPAALDHDDFTLVLRGVSRGYGHLSGGRFAALLAHDPASALLTTLARPPAGAAGALPVQLTFPSLASGASHIARLPRLQQHLVSVSEHRAPEPDTFTPDDLAVLCDGQRLHLVSRSRGQILDPSIPHPLQREWHTPWLARFCEELARAHTAVLTALVRAFHWGAAGALPVLPRLRYGRTVLSPATWSLDRDALPGPDATPAAWEDAVADLRTRWRLPDAVLLEDFDQRLPLHLDDTGHLALLRHHLHRAQHPLALTEAPDERAWGWCQGRPTEIVTLLRSTTPPPPAPPVPASAPPVRPGGQVPGASPYLCVRLSGVRRPSYDHVLQQLPVLLAEFAGIPRWVLRGQQMTLVFRFPEGQAVGPAVQIVGAWAARLVKSGALGAMEIVPYRPHPGRWGGEDQLTAAETCFTADSAAVLHQLLHVHAEDARVLAAANTVAITAGFHGDIDAGLRWLAGQPKPTVARPLPRPAHQSALRLITADGRWARLRTLPGGDRLADRWDTRHQALAAYRTALGPAPRIDTDAVLAALLHEHHRRTGAEEQSALRLARAVALAHRARHLTAGGAR